MKPDLKQQTIMLRKLKKRAAREKGERRKNESGMGRHLAEASGSEEHSLNRCQ